MLVRFISRTLFVVAAISFLVPKLTLGGLAIGLDDVVSLLSLPLVVGFVCITNFQKHPVKLWLIFVAFFSFILLSLIFGFLNSNLYLGSFIAPTELWQYVKRLMFFCVGYLLVYYSPHRAIWAYRVILITFFVAVVIGAVQFIGGGLADNLANLYGRTAHQIEMLLNRPMSSRRIFGVSGNSTAWGGLSGFMFLYAISMVLLREGVNRYRILAMLTAILAAVNLLLSGSRAAILGFLVAISIVSLWFVFTRRISLVKKVGVLFATAILIPGLGILLWHRIINSVFRFNVLVDQGGGERVEQIQIGLALLVSPFMWLFGIGNAAQRNFVVGYGIESEPIYLLVNYGLAGLSLLLLIIATLWFVSWQLLKVNCFEAKLYGTVLLGVVPFYMTFWFGYFFFQEIYVGTPFWLFSGLSVAVLELSQQTSETKASRQMSPLL